MDPNDFKDLIGAYKADNNDISSAIWIWFQRLENDAT